MSLALALTVGVLFATGTYLLLQRTLTRIVIGFALLGHGANLLLIASGGRAGRPAFVGGGTGGAADPLAQALVLTAIVIGFGMTGFLLTLAYRSWQLDGHDEAEDDLEDRRVARGEATDEQVADERAATADEEAAAS